MARSNGRAATLVALCAGLLFVNQLVAFVGLSVTSKSQLRSRVSLAATKSEIAAAKQKAQLLTWAASKLASDGSPEASAIQARAALAEAELEALKKGEAAPAAPPVSAAPVAAAPVAAAPVATPSTVSKADLEAAKKKAQLLTWAASKLVSDASPEASAMQARAALAVAEFEALKKGEAAPVAPPVSAAPVAAAPVAAAPVATPSTVSKADLEAAKKKAQLLTWAASKLASDGSPEASAIQARAVLAEAEFEALKKGKAAPVAPTVAVAPVAAAPAVVVTAPTATRSTVSKADLAAAEKKAQLLTWAAAKVDGSPTAPAMQAKADAAVAEVAALKKLLVAA